MKSRLVSGTSKPTTTSPTSRVRTRNSRQFWRNERVYHLLSASRRINPQHSSDSILYQAFWPVLNPAFANRRVLLRQVLAEKSQRHRSSRQVRQQQIYFFLHRLLRPVITAAIAVAILPRKMCGRFFLRIISLPVNWISQHRFLKRPA